MAKKKKVMRPSSSKNTEVDSASTSRTESRVPSPLSVTGENTTDNDMQTREEVKAVPFKSPLYEVKRATKKRIWKGLKQILAHERSLPWSPDAVLYSHIEAPPSFRPAKKYSDISGLPAKYTDPQTQLRFSLAEEFQTIRTMPGDIVAGYLALRKAANPVG